jgi:hypothetical protein
MIGNVESRSIGLNQRELQLHSSFLRRSVVGVRRVELQTHALGKV